nr:DUF2484 family protein [Palleronia pontilimi]
MVAAFAWLAGANVIAMLPSKRQHWPSAYALMAVGAPLAAWLWLTVGLLAAGLFMLAAASVLRWPVVYAARWVRARLR